MTAPSYTEDLSDVDLAEADTSWVEFTGNSYNTQGATAGADGDYPFIQGSFSVTQDCTKDASVGSLGAATGGITLPADGAAFVWQNYMVASNVGTYAQGGFRVVMGSGLADFKAFYVGGVDKAPYPYGGWNCHVANYGLTADDTAGTPGATINYIGAAVYVVTGSSKGEVHNVDAIRYGRGSSIFEHGDGANGYCTFAGFATQNDNNSNRWGLLQETAGGYLWQGKMTLGTSTNLVDFRDSNTTIFVKWTPKVTTNFNTIEVNNASSNIDMTGITFTVLDTTTASKGRWLTRDNATIGLSGCTFIDMDTFRFASNTDLKDTTFRRCGTITTSGATVRGCTIANSTGASSILTSDIDTIYNTSFESDGSNHAIEIDTAGEYDLIGLTYTGYASVSGSTGNECIYNNSGGFVTLNVLSGDVPTIRNSAGSQTAVVAAYTLTLTGIPSGSRVTIMDGTTELKDVVTVTDPENVVYSYEYSGDVLVNIYIMNLQYEAFDIDYTLTNENASIPIQMRRDRWYNNPVGP